jgi:agmatinase
MATDTIAADARATTSGDDDQRLPFETAPDSKAVPRSFYNAPLCNDLSALDAKVAFLGIPYDMGAANPGARFAPDVIRDTRRWTYQGGDTASGYYDLDTDRMALAGVTMADCGNVTIIQGETERNFWRITRAVRAIVARKAFLVAVGGDHAITPAVVRGLEAFGTLDIVHFDAHHDYWDHAQGIRWPGGMAIRRAAEFAWVRNITQIGMRQLGLAREPTDTSQARGNRIITSDRFRELGPEGAIDQVPRSDALYVTIDVDVLDNTVAPGASSPEPGGLSYLEMRATLRALAKRGRVVAVDLVEVSPPNDPTGTTARTASRLVIEFLDAIFPS